jgi:hypothetical protein
VLRLRRVGAAAALVAATLAVMWPTARDGSPIGHDSQWHYVWAAQFVESLAAGVLYPRWLPGVNEGLGNPTFVFYPPLLYYLGAAGWALTGSVPRGLDVANALMLLVSAIAAYRYLRGGLPRPAALLGAFALMALPYRILDLYERHAIAEFAAFAWPPLALVALRHVARAPSWPAAGPAAAALAGATAGVALTHLPSLLLWGPLFALEAVRLAGPGRRLPGVARAWVALGLGLLAAAVFLLPAVVERSSVQIGWLDWVAKAEEHTIFSTRMAHGSQMMAFNHRVGRFACWTGALALVAALALLWPGGGRAVAEAPAGEPSPLPVRPAILVGLVAFGLMTGPSAWLWAWLPLLPSIQFPWRFLCVLTPVAALLAAGAANRTFAPGTPAAARALGVAALALLGSNLWLSWAEIVEKTYRGTRTALEIAAFPARAQDAAEYRPLAAPAAGFPRLPKAALLPEGQASPVEWRPTRRRIVVDAPLPGRLRVATFFYPGWRATLDGRALPIRAGQSGVIEADVPPGRHEVVLRFGGTPGRAAGAALSLVGLGLMVGWLAWGVRERRGGPGRGLAAGAPPGGTVS